MRYLAFFVAILYTSDTVTTRSKQDKKLLFKQHLRRHVKLAVIPHKANQYQPHLIRRYGLVAVIVVVVGIQLLYNVSTTGTVLGDQASISAATLLKDTNDVRHDYQLPSLNLNQKLSQAAYLKAADMFTKQYWAHTSPEGTQPWKWFGDVGYNYSDAGENLAKNFHTPEAITTAWLGSPEHRANILGVNYSDVGFATVDGTLAGKPTTIVVALYGRQETPSVAGAQSTTAASTSSGPIGVVSRLGIAAQSMTPALIGSIILLGFVASIAFTTHLYRNKLPKSLRQSWRRHQGAIKFGGIFSIMIIMLFLYSGGQI